MIEAIILGLVQGLTEFLPISSSAHLRILGEFLPNAQDPGAAFTAIVQIGTLMTMAMLSVKNALDAHTTNLRYVFAALAAAFAASVVYKVVRFRKAYSQTRSVR